MKKVLQQGEMIQKRLVEMNDKPRLSPQPPHQRYYEQYSNNNSDFEIAQCDDLSSLPSCSKWNNAIMTDTEDELFLVIENNNDNDSGVFISKEQRFHEMEIDECKHFVQISTPKRKFRHTREFESLRDHAINTIHSTENFARTSCKFELIHKELRSEINSVKEIIDQEQSFLTKITSLDDKKFFSSDNNFVNNISEFCDNNDTVIL